MTVRARVAVVVDGPPSMLEVAVPGGASRVALPDGPLPVRVLSVDDQGTPTGEVVVWITDGYLSALEYAWYTGSSREGGEVGVRV